MTTGVIPSVRYPPGSAVIKDNLIIFNISDIDHHLYSLNTISSEWTNIPINLEINSLSEPRSVASMFSFEDNLYVFGGYK